jgi:hypothetical protein
MLKICPAKAKALRKRHSSSLLFVFADRMWEAVEVGLVPTLDQPDARERLVPIPRRPIHHSMSATLTFHFALRPTKGFHCLLLALGSPLHKPVHPSVHPFVYSSF